MRAGQELFEGSWREPQEPLLHQVTSSRPAFSNLFSEAGQLSTEGLCPQASILMPPLRKPSPAPPEASRLIAQHSRLAPKHPLYNRRGLQAAANSLWLLPSPLNFIHSSLWTLSLHTLTFLQAIISFLLAPLWLSALSPTVQFLTPAARALSFRGPVKCSQNAWLRRGPDFTLLLPEFWTSAPLVHVTM